MEESRVVCCCRGCFTTTRESPPDRMFTCVDGIMTVCSEGVSGSFTATATFLLFCLFHACPDADAWKAPAPLQLISRCLGPTACHFATCHQQQEARRPSALCEQHTPAHTQRYLPMSVSRAAKHKLKVKLSGETFQFKFNFQRSGSIMIVFFFLRHILWPLSCLFSHI